MPRSIFGRQGATIASRRALIGAVQEVARAMGQSGMSAVTIPILPSADFDATTQFWSLFGFAELGRWPGYLIIGQAELAVELHFWLNPTVDRWTNDVGCYVRFPSPEAARSCFEGWRTIAVPASALLGAPRELDEVPGSLEFPVIDIHGNLVRFGGFRQ